MKVLFLIGDAFGIGGTIRTTFNLASTLSGRHDVEVLSMFRRRDVPHLPVDPAVRLMSLVELRERHPDFARDDPRRGRPAPVFPRGEYRRGDYDLLVERRAAAYLRASDADVAIATRAGLIAYLARFAPDRMIRIGQEHLTRAMNPAELRRAMAPHYRRLDAFVTVSAGDAEDYRRHLRLRHTRLVFIPNSVPRPRVAPSDGTQELIVAAGRLVRSKRYDVLIRAFAKVLAERPRWRLRVYGIGEEAAELRALVQELGLSNSVLLMGPHTPIESEWAKGAIAAVTSDREPFGMTIVEAMRCGAPVVSTDAPYGPGEIISDGADGRLVPVDDVDAIAGALLELINDPARRARMAAAGLATGERYDPAAIAERYEELVAELVAARAARSRTVAGRLRAAGRVTGPFRVADRPGEPVAFGPAPQGTLLTADCTMPATDEILLHFPAARPDEAAAQRGGGAAAPGGAGRIVCVAGDDEHAVDLAPDVRLALPEGAWLVFRQRPGGGREPVLAGVRDTRPLMGHDLRTAARVAVALPHRRPDGQLGIRVWRRERHVEVGDVHVAGASVTVTGRVVGAGLGTAPAVILRSRPDPAVTHRCPVRAVGADGLRFDIDYDAITRRRWAAHDAWDAFLDTDAGPIRLGRVLDDVFDKKTAFAYPESTVDGVRVRPYYTADNGFSLLVSDPNG